MAYTYYNLTNLTGAGNQTTILTFVDEINSTLLYVPMILILVAIFIILFLQLLQRGYDGIRSFTAAAFVCMVLAIITYPMGLIPGSALVTFLILVPGSMFILWVWGGKTI